MPIPFHCPHCGAQTNVADEYAGQSGPCAACGQQITVPNPDGMAAAPPKPSSGSNTLVISLVVFGCMALLICPGILIALLLPAVQAARESARRMSCSNNLKQIGLALHNYHDTWNTFPPAYLADEDGQPQHSWRVLLLPYLEQGPLYEQYDFDQPWDSPANQWVTEQVIPAYRCPSSSDGLDNGTNYRVITGEGMLFDKDQGSSIASITDGTSWTLMVVEVPGASVPWAAPYDLDASSLDWGINGGGDEQIGSRHPGGAMMLFADGSVQFLSDGLSVEQLKAYATPAGGERMGH